MEGIVGIKKFIPDRNSYLKIDVDHVNFAVAARNQNLSYWTKSLEVCWRVRPTTFATAITGGMLLSSFPFVDTLQ
jgi:hypothetical protein